MHSQHGASHTSVNLLQIRIKLELDTWDFFRALYKIVSTKRKNLTAPVKFATLVYILYCIITVLNSTASSTFPWYLLYASYSKGHFFFF